MESFIVRVYRRSRTKTGEIAGFVETVGTDEKRAFQSFVGLTTTLMNAVLRGEANAVNPAKSVGYPSLDKKQAG